MLFIKISDVKRFLRQCKNSIFFLFDKKTHHRPEIQSDGCLFIAAAMLL